MASRASLHLQLSSIMETMVRSVLSQVYKLVDEDTGELRSELSRLRVANSALAEKVTSLEGELTALRSDAPKLGESYRSLGVQTVCCSDAEDARVSGPPTIEGIFGKDWCMNLWKDRDPNSAERVPDKSQTCEKVRGSTAEVIQLVLHISAHTPGKKIRCYAGNIKHIHARSHQKHLVHSNEQILPA